MNLVIFLLLCLFTTFVGAGILYVFGFKNADHPIFMAAPLIALCFWVLVLGIGVTLQIPVRMLAYPIWGVSFIFCFISFRRLNFRKFILPGLGMAGTALVAALLYLIHDFSNYAGSPFADGWSYIAMGQYLWELPKCVEGGLAPLYEYAAHLCQTRFVASSLLGFLSPITGAPGDTQAGGGFFFPWVFFIYASACMVFIKKYVSGWLSWLYVFLCVVSGWSLLIMWANNFDQSLAICLVPGIAAVVEMDPLNEKQRGSLVAILLASSVYAYPEMTPFIFLVTLILFLSQVIRDRRTWSSVLQLGVFLILPFIALVAVNFSNWIGFLLSQLHTNQAAVRPGEGMAQELLEGKYWFVGLWGLGGKILTQENKIFETMILALRYVGASILLLFSILGFGILVKIKNWGVLISGLILSAAILYFLVVQKYPYGAYKIITLTWWIVAFTIILAFQWLGQKKYFPRMSLVTWGVLILAMCIFGLVYGLRNIQLDGQNKVQSILPYKELSTARYLVNNASMAVSVNDPTANLWAIYYLRNSATAFLSYQSYPNQPHVLPFMLRSQKVDEQNIKYLLTDSANFKQLPDSEKIWQNQIYTLWQIKEFPKILITNIENPNGLETMDGQSFFWIGDQETLVTISSSNAGFVEISADFLPGPSIPESSQRTLSVKLGKEFSAEFQMPDTKKIIIPVKVGSNLLSIKCLDQARLTIFPNGDTRKLLVGVKNLRAVFKP